MYVVFANKSNYASESKWFTANILDKFNGIMALISIQLEKKKEN